MVIEEVSRSQVLMDGINLAVRVRGRPESLGFFWLNGYRSDMLGTKACYVDSLAKKLDSFCLRFDYSGHGESGGEFILGTISKWLSEAAFVYEKFATAPQILIGSSMGGWIALRLYEILKAKGKAPKGIILLAPAPDFTKALLYKKMTEEQKKSLAEKGYFEEPSAYSPEPNIFTKALLEDGENNLIMQGLLEIDCPVHILHGMKDVDVPYEHSLALLEHLPKQNVNLSLIHDGDHPLSRAQDLVFLEKIICMMREQILQEESLKST